MFFFFFFTVYGNINLRDARFQAKAWIQALAIYFQAICFSFLCTNWTILDSLQAHSCFLTGNPVKSEMIQPYLTPPLICFEVALFLYLNFSISLQAKELYNTRCIEFEKLKREGITGKDLEKAETKYKKTCKTEHERETNVNFWLVFRQYFHMLAFMMWRTK